MALKVEPGSTHLVKVTTTRQQEQAIERMFSNAWHWYVAYINWEDKQTI